MSNLDKALECFRAQQACCAVGRSLGMDAEYFYLHGTPESFVKSCDVLLKLDDGSELPAHSHYLARCTVEVRHVQASLTCQSSSKSGNGRSQ